MTIPNIFADMNGGRRSISRIEKGRKYRGRGGIRGGKVVSKGRMHFVGRIMK